MICVALHRNALVASLALSVLFWMAGNGWAQILGAFAKSPDPIEPELALESPAEARSLLATTGDPITDDEVNVTHSRINLESPVNALPGLLQTFTIFNDGHADLKITSMTRRDNSPWLDFSPKAPFSIAPGESREVAVQVDWELVPGSGDDDQIVVESNDEERNPYQSGVYVQAQKGCSTAPVIEDVTFDRCISELCRSTLSVTATDPCGGRLAYAWMALDGGGIIGSGASVQFDPPATGPHPCPYQVKVMATSDASGLSTSETTNVYIKVAGDANEDGNVDALDRLLVRNHFGETPASPSWDPRADVNCDGRVDVLDRLTVRNQFGQTGCQCQ